MCGGKAGENCSPTEKRMLLQGDEQRACVVISSVNEQLLEAFKKTSLDRSVSDHSSSVVSPNIFRIKSHVGPARS